MRMEIIIIPRVNINKENLTQDEVLYETTFIVRK